MPLQDQTIEIPLGGGVRQDVDHRLLPLGGLAEVTNGRYDHTGAIVHRPGFGRLPSLVVGASALPTPRHVETAGDEVLAYVTEDLTRQPTIYSVVGSTPTQWSKKGRLPPCAVKRLTGPRPAYDGAKVSSCYSLADETYSYLVHVYVVNAASPYDRGVMVRIDDIATGAVIVNDFTISNTVGPVCAAIVADVLHIVQSTSLGLEVFRYNLATLALLSTVNLDATAGTYYFDAVKNGNYLLVAYAMSGTNITVSQLAIAGTIFATTTLAARPTSVCVAAEPGESNFFVCYFNSTGSDFYTAGFNTSSLGVLYAPVATTIGAPYGATYAIAAGVDNDGQCNLLIQGRVQTPVYVSGLTVVEEHGIHYSRYGVGGALQFSTPKIYHAQILARPCQVLGKLFLTLSVGEPDSADLTYQGPHVLAMLDPDPQGGRYFELVGVLTRSAYAMPQVATDHTIPRGTLSPYGTRGLYGALPIVLKIKANAAPVAATAVDGELGLNGDAAGAHDAVFLDFNEANANGLWTSAKAGGAMVVGGSYLASYDGEGTSEQSFIYYPRIRFTGPDSSGGFIVAGTYLYRAYFEHTDARGNTHYSEASPPMAAVVPGVASGSVVLTVWYLSLTGRDESNAGTARPVRIRIVRTKVGGEGDYYHIANVALAPSGTAASPKNFKTVHCVQITDTLIDTALTAAAYFAGGVLESQCPVASAHVLSHNRRLWAISSENPRRIYYTRAFQQGDAPQWNDILFLELPDSPDGAVALAGLDGSVLALTPTRIYTIDGEGPGDTGEPGNAFAPPRLVTTDVGCTDARSVASFAKGVAFYSSAGGFSLVTKGFGVEYLGAPVQDTAEGGSYDQCASACVHPTLGTIVFLMTDSTAVVAPKWVAYDYVHSAWATWTPTSTTVKNCAVATNGKLHYASDDGIFRESYGANPGIDPEAGGAWPSLIVTTPWIHLQTLGGYQRARRVMLTLYKRSVCRVIVYIYANFNDVDYVEYHEIDLGSATTINGVPYVRCDVPITNQKLSAIRIKIADAEATSTGVHIETHAAEDIVTDGGDYLSESTTLAATVTTDPIGIDLASIAIRIGVKAQTAKLPAVNRST